MESQAVFQAETQAKLFLLNCPPVRVPRVSRVLRPQDDRVRHRRRGPQPTLFRLQVKRLGALRESVGSRLRRYCDVESHRQCCQELSWFFVAIISHFCICIRGHFHS